MMTPLEKYSYWVALSDYDMDTAEALIKAERWTYVTVICQQAVERLAKGMYVYHIDKEAPKSHNISFLMNKLCQCESFANDPIGKIFCSEKEQHEEFLIDLMFYYMSDYPFSYKKIKDRFISKETATEIYTKTQELIIWLKGYQPATVDVL